MDTQQVIDYLPRKDAAQDRRAWLIVLVVLGLAAYLPIFYSLAISCTGGDSYYAHWFLIPPVSAFFIWLKRDEVRRLPVQGRGWGLPLAIGSILLHILAIWFRVDFVSAFSFVLTIWCLTLYFFGTKVLRQLSFPLVFLLFMVPLPGTAIAPLAFHMKILSGKMAVRLYNVIGGAAILTGSKISFAEGDPLWMGYECSGLKSVISLSALGAAMAHLGRVSRPRKVILFLSSFPLAILSNAVRVTSLCFAADQWGVKSKAFKVFHDVSSPVVFLAVLVGLFGVQKLLSIGKGDGQGQAERAQNIPAGAAPPMLFRLIPRRKIAVVAGLFAASAVLVMLSPHFLRTSSAMSSLEPVSLPDRVGTWSASTTEAVEREEVFSILNTRSIAVRDYRDPEGKEVQVLVVASDTDRQAFHPPEICMIGAGSEVLERWQEPIDIPSGESSRLHLNAFVRGTEGQPETLVLYWYMAGRKSTGNRAAQQLSLLLNGARTPAIIGAMVRVTAPLFPASKAEALAWSKTFIRSLVPLMPRLLEEARQAEKGSRE